MTVEELNVINNFLQLRSIGREYISVRLFNICIAYANVSLIIIRTVYKYKLDEGYSSRTFLFPAKSRMAKQNPAQDSQDERIRSLITSSISSLTANIATVVDDRLLLSFLC